MTRLATDFGSTLQVRANVNSAGMGRSATMFAPESHFSRFLDDGQARTPLVHSPSNLGGRRSSSGELNNPILTTMPTRRRSSASNGNLGGFSPVAEASPGKERRRSLSSTLSGQLLHQSTLMRNDSITASILRGNGLQQQVGDSDKDDFELFNKTMDSYRPGGPQAHGAACLLLLIYTLVHAFALYEDVDCTGGWLHLGFILLLVTGLGILGGLQWYRHRGRSPIEFLMDHNFKQEAQHNRWDLDASYVATVACCLLMIMHAIWTDLDSQCRIPEDDGSYSDNDDESAPNNITSSLFNVTSGRSGSGTLEADVLAALVEADDAIALALWLCIYLATAHTLFSISRRQSYVMVVVGTLTFVGLAIRTGFNDYGPTWTKNGRLMASRWVPAFFCLLVCEFCLVHLVHWQETVANRNFAIHKDARQYVRRATRTSFSMAVNLGRSQRMNDELQARLSKYAAFASETLDMATPLAKMRATLSKATEGKLQPNEVQEVLQMLQNIMEDLSVSDMTTPFSLLDMKQGTPLGKSALDHETSRWVESALLSVPSRSTKDTARSFPARSLHGDHSPVADGQESPTSVGSPLFSSPGDASINEPDSPLHTSDKIKPLISLEDSKTLECRFVAHGTCTIHPDGCSATRPSLDMFGQGDMSPPGAVDDSAANHSLNQNAAPTAFDVALRRQEMSELMKGVGTWAFDVFAVEDCYGGGVLRHTAWQVLRQTRMLKVFPIHPKKLVRFCQEVERGMKRTNGYHNALHVADVINNVAFFIREFDLKNLLSDIQILALILAALVHDFKHPGVNNDFLIQSKDTLAITYNDKSVLENYHASEAFRLLQSSDHNFIERLSKEDATLLRTFVIDIILATDLKRHFSMLDQFQSRTEKIKASISSNMKDADPQIPLLLMQMAMKCADIGHLAKVLNYHKRWVEGLNQEFYAQGDREVASGIPVSPFCDRRDANVPKSQVGFYSFVGIPMYNAWFSVFGSNNVVAKELDENFKYWKELAELEASTYVSKAPKALSDGDKPTMGDKGDKDKDRESSKRGDDKV